MTFAWTPYALPFLLASLLTAGLGGYVSRHRDTGVGSAFLVVLCSITIWMFLEGMIVLGTDLETKLALGRSCYPALMAIAPALVVVAKRAHADRELRRWQWLLMLIVPVLSLPLLLLDPVPGPIFAAASIDETAPFPRRVIERGPWYHVIVLHSYLLVAWATWHFVRRTRQTWGTYGFDGAMMIAGVVLPWAAVTMHILAIEPVKYIDAAPFGFVIMSIFLLLGFKRSGLLGVMGVGRRGVVDVMIDAVLVMDRRGLVLDANDAARRILDIGDGWFVGATAAKMFKRHPGLADAYNTLMLRSESNREFDLVIDGDKRSFDLGISEMGSGRGSSSSHVLVLRDITDRRRAELGLERESMYISLIQQVAVAANDAHGENQALLASLRLISDTMRWPVALVFLATGDPERPLIATTLFHIADPERFREIDREAAALGEIETESVSLRALRTQQSQVVDHDCAMDDPRIQLASRYGLRATLAMPVILHDEVPAVFEFASDHEIECEEELIGVFKHIGAMMGGVIERKRNEERIRELAYYDGLTGLPNRELFLGRLDRTLSDAQANQRTAALLFVDLDGFKRINDTLGHAAGDALLRGVSERFSADVRSSDILSRLPASAESSISRLGGDEFTVLLGEIASAQDAALVATRLKDSLSAPFEICGEEVFIAASVGIAVYPHDARNAEELLRNADAAMYSAKQTGAVEFYSDSMNRESRQRLKLERLLRHAIASNALELHYQPCRDARSGRIVAAEALLRWEQPGEGTISPAEFIPVAERSGLIVPLGDWALETACRQAMRWRAQGLTPIRIAVNLSGVQIRHAGLVERVAAILERSELPPTALELEITETAIRADDSATVEALQALHEMGVSLALDDFGTGTSSLTHLRSFPIQRVKIDRGFVAGTPHDPQDASLTAAIIAMAHGLGLSVVAEGVENEEQAHFLTERGCDVLQGFLFSRAVPADELASMLDFDPLHGKE